MGKSQGIFHPLARAKREIRWKMERESEMEEGRWKMEATALPPSKKGVDRGEKREVGS